MTHFIVGLTGGIASGKTVASNYLQRLGAYVVDTDVVARQVVEPQTSTYLLIRALLGAAYFHDDGHLNRHKIRQRIFSDNAIKTQYEAIILPAIREKTRAAMAEAPADAPYVLLVVPLLFEKGMDEWVDVSVVIDVPESLQITRALKRDQAHTNENIEQIISQQMPRLVRNARADFVIDNALTLEKTQQRLNILHQQLVILAQRKQQSCND